MAHMADDYRVVSPSELQAYRAWVVSAMKSYEDSYLQYRAGTLAAEIWETDAAVLRGFASSAAFRTEWSLSRGIASGSYRDYLDDLIRDTPVSKQSLSHADWIARYEKQLTT